jgi:hypothetical protein
MDAILVAHLFRMFVEAAAVPALTIGAVILYRRRRTKPTLFLLLGLVVALLGEAVQVVASRFSKVSYINDSSGEVLGATIQPSPLWYVGSTVFSIGIIVVVLAFLWSSFIEPRITK